MLQACVLDFKVQWDEHLPLCEFAYNNSNHSSIGMAPFEHCMEGDAEPKFVGKKSVCVAFTDRR